MTALRSGYRHIDSAQYYANEKEVGHAVQKSGIPRSEVYLTSKILVAGDSDDDAYQRIVESVKTMDSSPNGYVDLFLIHSPNAGLQARQRMWKALERAHKEGKIRDIGVSNYGKGHIEEMKKYATVWPPVVNQIELHPWCQQRECVEYCQKNNIVVEAYAPLVRNQKADDPTLCSIAKKVNRSTGQVLVRWAIQRGFVPLPKSDTPSRIESNADLYEFELSKEDMDALTGLDQGAKGAIVQAVDNS